MDCLAPWPSHPPTFEQASQITLPQWRQWCFEESFLDPRPPPKGWMHSSERHVCMPSEKPTLKMDEDAGVWCIRTWVLSLEFGTLDSKMSKGREMRLFCGLELRLQKVGKEDCGTQIWQSWMFQLMFEKGCQAAMVFFCTLETSLLGGSQYCIGSWFSMFWILNRLSFFLGFGTQKTANNPWKHHQHSGSQPIYSVVFAIWNTCWVIYWLVVYLPLWKIWKSVGMMTFPIYGTIIQMFQTTNQIIIKFPLLLVYTD